MWLYNKEEMTEIPEGAFGFVYLIVDTITGKVYIGRKNFYSTQTKKLSVKELNALTDKRASKKKTVVKESDWRKYNSSNSELKNEIKSRPNDFKKEILKICYHKKELTYYELHYQVLMNVLTIDSWNDNICGKYFRKDLNN